MELKRFNDIVDSQDLLEETIAQLYKDLSIDETTFRWQADLPDAYDQFRKDVESYVFEVLKMNRRVLMQLLYRVDISEKKSQTIWAFDENTRAKMLTEMVLNRELQKVLTRRLYKQK